MVCGKEASSGEIFAYQPIDCAAKIPVVLYSPDPFPLGGLKGGLNRRLQIQLTSVGPAHTHPSDSYHAFERQTKKYS